MTLDEILQDIHALEEDMVAYIKHHRVPAPELSFTRPNLPVLIAEIERDRL